MTIKLNTKNQKGQAITEFNVVAAFVLVPLFIMIPLLGKFIDMKHSSVQAARYMAWERTVWFEESTRPDKYPARNSTARVKIKSVLENETRNRFFGEVSEDELESNKINPLWNDRGSSLLAWNKIELDSGKNEDVPSFILPGKRSVFYTILDAITKGVDIVANLGAIIANYLVKLFNGILDYLSLPLKIPLVSNDGIHDKLQFKGYYKARVSMELDNALYKRVFCPAGSGDSCDAPVIESHAAVLTNSWVTEGNDQFAEWTRGLVPFSPLEAPFKIAKKIFTYSPLPGVIPAIAPELGGMEFGYVSTDPVPDSSEIPDCGPGGLCEY